MKRSAAGGKLAAGLVWKGERMTTALIVIWAFNLFAAIAVLSLLVVGTR